MGGTVYASTKAEFERTVNYNTSIAGLSIAYSKVINDFGFAIGLRNIDIEINTTDNYISSPIIAYSTVGWTLGNVLVLSEINTGDFPVKAGVSYKLASLLQVQSGVKYDADAKNVYGSFGLSANVENFKFGFAVSNLLHDLGPTAHYSLAWKFR